jgi:hypothetical protein
MRRPSLATFQRAFHTFSLEDGTSQDPKPKPELELDYATKAEPA